MSLAILLLVMLIQGVLGTFPPGFPPVSNPPPIPAEVVRTNSQTNFFVQEDIPPQPNVREEELFQPETKPDNLRWYFQENQSSEISEPQTSVETFDTYYQNGEPAIGPVATPIPDDTYLAQPYSISRLNPSDTGSIDSDVWILTRGSDTQYNTQDRQIQAEVPNYRIVEVVNQDPRSPAATDSVKTFVGPALTDAQVKSQLPSNSPPSIVQQVWVQESPPVGSQKEFPTAVLSDIPSVKQIIQIPQTSARQAVQSKIISAVPSPPPPSSVQITAKQGVAAPLPPPASAQIITKQGFAPPPPASAQIITKQGYAAPPLPPAPSQIITKQLFAAQPPPPAPSQIVTKQGFSAPPPPPPPLKGLNVSPKVISSVPVNINPDSNVIVSDKIIAPNSNIVVPGKSVLQQVRHIWIPTSPRTGKFITVPVSSFLNAGKSVAGKGLSLDSTPVTVSDTWVLKQDGPIPSFQQQKSVLPPPIVQNGKVLIQNPPVIQVSKSPSPVAVAPVLPAKSVPVVGKSVVASGPPDIWPVRNDATKSVVRGKSQVLLTQVSPIPAGKTNAAVIGKSVPPPPPLPPPTVSQKTVLINAKSSIPPPVPPPAVPVLNSKPCPLPLSKGQKSLLSSKNPSTVPVPQFIATQNFPFARIIRVNRYPSGSYYLLNRNIRPNYFMYPSQSLIQQPKTGYIRLIQTKQIPVPFQGKQLLPPLPQTKQITIPVQSKQIVSPLSAKPITYPYPARQIILPITSPKSTRIIYPAVQAIRYPYPLSAYLNSSPLNKGLYAPQLSPLKVGPTESSSDSSSSESSSSEASSESSAEGSKEEKGEKSESGESESSVESESSSESKGESESGSISESESESTSKEKTEETSEPSSELEVEESQLSYSRVNPSSEGFKLNPQRRQPRILTHENTHVNYVANANANGKQENSNGYEADENFARD